MSEEQLAEELTGDTGDGTLWIELPPEAVENHGSCDEDCVGVRYHHHWHCNTPGGSCSTSPAKPVVTGLTAKTEKSGILEGTIWGGYALCQRHDSSVTWDSVQARKARHESEDEWEDERLEEEADEEAEEYVPSVVHYVRATWTDEAGANNNLSRDRAYQPNLVCRECAARTDARPVVTIRHFHRNEHDTDWINDHAFALCRKHDNSVTPAVARAYLRRLASEKKRALVEKVKAKQAKEGEKL